jgi:tetratricopeptide (TPR) repeat protein
MKTNRLIQSFTVAAALACALPLTAQMSGGIKGTITGMDGKPVQKAVVTITRTDIPGKAEVKTDKHGAFADYALQVGTYDISATLPDGKTTLVIRKGVTTHVGDAQVIDVDLKAAAAEQAAAEGKAPPGMSKEQAAAYEKKMKDQEEANKKLGTLNGLLAQNKQLSDAKQYDQAIAVMEQAVALDQTKDILYANLADDYSNAKQYDKAADAYNKAIALKPTNAGYVINLGTVLSKEGKIDEANAAFSKAATMDPTQAKMAMYNSAVILLNQGNLDAAAPAFDKLLALDPQNGDAWYYKAICLLGKATTDAKGNIIPPPGAVEALQNSLKYAPNGPNAATAKAELQTLKGSGGL